MDLDLKETNKDGKTRPSQCLCLPKLTTCKLQVTSILKTDMVMKENTSIIMSDDVELQETFRLLIHQACIYICISTYSEQGIVLIL